MSRKYFIKRNLQYVFNQMMVVILILVIIFQISCKKMVEINPPITSISNNNVYTNDATATAVLTGIYASMGNGDIYTGSNGISIRSGLSADELTLWSGGFGGGLLQQFYENNLMAQQPSDYWVQFYSKLLTINSAIEGLEESNSLTPTVKMQLLGESKFLRAFFHFYLVNFFGDVPLATSSDWRITGVSGRTNKDEVYNKIIADLIEAKELLGEQYVKGDAQSLYPPGKEERVRPTKWAATALLARVYLYINKWSEAETQATIVINNSALYKLNTLQGAFAKNSVEAIWQIQYVNTNFGTEGYHFILKSAPNFVQPTSLSSFLLSSFDSGDLRRSTWIDSFKVGSSAYYYPFKYRSINNPNTSEYFMVLRFAEQYLIRAEARAQQNKINDAQADLNLIRLRSKLGTAKADDKASLLAAILHERQLELFTEWGHRWLDLKRTGTIDAIMNVVYPKKKPGSSWNSNWQLYPLSINDIKISPSLAPNNPGY